MLVVRRWGLCSRRSFCAEARWIASSWEVSSCGRVRSRTGIVSHGALSCEGYRRVTIGREMYSVHRLVAATFLGPPPASSKWEVNHIDNDRSNNHVWNLVYATRSENVQHSWAVNASRGTTAEKLGKSVLWRPCGSDSWSPAVSQASAAKLLGVSEKCISRCCRGLAASCKAGTARYEFQGLHEPEPLLDGEVWKPATLPHEENPISGLFVSSHGRILSSSFRHKYVSRGCCNASGYYAVRKAGRAFLVHRLVAGTFLAQPACSSLQVNHKDSDRGNNHVQNLEYVTASQNMRHAAMQRNGRWQRARRGKLVEARLAGSHGAWLQFESIRAAAAHTGTTTTLISRICQTEPGSHLPTGKWDFRFASDSQELPGEEWRPVVLEGARAPVGKE